MSPVPTRSTPSNQTNQTAFTPAQLEAQAILTHLLSHLSQPPPPEEIHAKTDLYADYRSWISHHSIPTLTSTIFSLIRPQVWHILSSRLSIDTLKSLGGDLRLEGRAIYLNGILGTDKRLRIYVGQTGNLRQRIGQHLNFRYRRDHPSLHYWALEWSVYNVFGVLAVVLPSEGGNGGGGGVVAGMERLDLVMNVLEMWMCLVFRSLPTDTLQEWLPSSLLVDDRKRLVAKEGVVGGLNVASPLDQGTDVKQMPFVNLSGEEDSIIQSYLQEVQRRKGGRAGSLNAKEERKMKDVEVEVKVDEEERALRKKMYAEKARAYSSRRRDTDIVIPQWIFLGVVAVGVGVSLFRSSGGPGGSGRWR
jgi:hypothetical protein